MREDRNQFQIIRKDARNCFVESLNDSFSIGRIHLAFAAYDQSKPAGQRQTNNVHIYIAVDEFLELCRKLDCGELRYMLQSKKKNGDNTPLYQCLGGTSAEKLRTIGRARPDGKSLSRVAQLVPANKADFLFVADSGPGETNEKGLIVPKFSNKPENHVAVMMSFESLSEMFLITRMHFLLCREGRKIRMSGEGRHVYGYDVYARRTERGHLADGSGTGKAEAPQRFQHRLHEF